MREGDREEQGSEREGDREVREGGRQGSEREGDKKDTQEHRKSTREGEKPTIVLYVFYA